MFSGLSTCRILKFKKQLDMVRFLKMKMRLDPWAEDPE